MLAKHESGRHHILNKGLTDKRPLLNQRALVRRHAVKFGRGAALADIKKAMDIGVPLPKAAIEAKSAKAGSRSVSV
jgi:hypothetical protein